MDFIFNLILGSIWGVWLSLPLLAQLLIVLAIILFVGGTVYNWGKIVKAVAGWPGVAALVAFITAVVVAIASTRPSPKEKPAPRNRELPSVVIPQTKKGKRTFNLETSTWE